MLLFGLIFSMIGVVATFMALPFLLDRIDEKLAKYSEREKETMIFSLAIFTALIFLPLGGIMLYNVEKKPLQVEQH